MQLEHQLVLAESRERLSKRIAIGGLLSAAVAFPIIASGVFGGADPYDQDATILSVGAGVIYFVGWSAFFIATASYFSRFLPRLRRTREELLNESIRELRHDVAELRQLIEGKSKVHKSNQNGPG